ncbi:MAG TPA: nuclear transport factor 2 family protein [Jatrophihabitantaceae bacterium]|jgi:ketosteroid isomerase-like protein
MTATPEEVFHRLVNGVSRLVAGDATQADALPMLYAEQTRVEHPMAFPAVKPLLSRDELRRHFAAGPGALPLISDHHPTDIMIHQTVDPEVIVAEFSYRGTVNGQAYVVPCVFVMRIRDGQIVESRDYINSQDRARAIQEAAS